jgi:cytochrome c oxidase cbb3-type subunit 4
VSYDALRHLADSWGLVMMGVFYLALVGWAFLPRSRGANSRAAGMIFDKDHDDG